MAGNAMMKLSFSTGTLYHLPLRTAFALARETGFAGVELVLSPEIILRGAAYVRKLSQEYALPVFSVHPPIVPYPGHSSAAAILPRLIALAEQVNCPLIVLHVPKVTAPEGPKWTEFLDTLLSERARANPGVQISLENPGFFRRSDTRYILHDARRLRAFADQYDLPITFDTAHAGASSYLLMEAYELFHERVVNVHFSDLVERHIFPDWPPLCSVLKHHQMPGEGILPLVEFAQHLVASGYSGIFTLEVSPTAIGAWNLTRVRQGLLKLVEFMQRLEAE